MRTVAQRLRNLPLQQKMMAILLLTCGTVLVLACAALFAFQSVTVKQNFTRDLAALGTVMAHNSAATAAFEHAEDAEQVLASLKDHPDITGASLVLANGRHLADFALKGAQDSAIEPGFKEGLRSIGDNIVLAAPVRVDGTVIATMYLRADFHSVQAGLLRLYGAVFGAILLGSLLLAFVMSRKLRPIITGPILRLAQTAKEISKHGDYTLRAEKAGADEVGVLTDAFNAMLEKVQAQDALHHEIAERKRSEVALRESEERFRSIAESASDAIVVTDEALCIQSWNQAAASMFGHPPEEVTGKKLITVLACPASAPCTEDARAELSAKIRNGVGETIELIGVRSSGAEFPMEVSVATWTTGDGTFFSTIIRDISERKSAEEALRLSQQQLLETSRRAGMAEIATGVLHNVGNILNSVNISTTLISEKVQKSVAQHIGSVAAMLRENAADLPRFFTGDERGLRLPAFIDKLAQACAEERKGLLGELEHLNKNVVHIKDVVAMQQTYARVAGVVETLQLSALVEDALEMNTAALGRHRVEVIREFTAAPSIQVDKHKVLQILVNLIRNAKHAMDASDNERKVLRVVVRPKDQATMTVTVSDNGVGISAECITKIFSHGFTTKTDGHGFGLHSSANAAKEMNGTLIAESEGPGLGASFILELPISPESSRGPASPA